MSKKVDVHIRCRDDPEDVWNNQGTSISYEKGNSMVTFRDFKSIFFKENNKSLYEKCIKNSIKEYLDNKNVTVFAYGQTGSGKTHTMTGNCEENGIIHMGLAELYTVHSIFTISCVEIYNERIFDLSNNSEVKMYTSGKKNTMKNLHIEKVDSLDCAIGFLTKCSNNRKVGITEYNINSSRSHSIVQIRKDDAILNFIDLAGSERASRFESRRSEGSFINKSLLALGTLVNNLLNGKLLGFRDSKLTRILQSSFDGDTLLIALCMISPHRVCVEESLSTLNFAARLSNIELKGHESAIIIEPPKVELNGSDQRKRITLKKRLNTYFDKKENNTDSGVLLQNKSTSSFDMSELDRVFDLQNLTKFSKNNSLRNNSMEEGSDDILSDYIDNTGPQSEKIDFTVPIPLDGEIVSLMDLLERRITSLEDFVTEMFKIVPDKQMHNTFLLEKHSFKLQKDIIRTSQNSFKSFEK